TTDLNAGVLCSAYKLLPSMEEKLKGQMDLAEKLRAVDESDVARLVIERHWVRDTRGNLRKFSMQVFRCVSCNSKFRRPPLAGRCTKCGGKIIFTISEGSVLKYMQPALDLAKEYGVSEYLTESLELTQMYIESVFGREKEKQVDLKGFF
ncbi:MAG: DNA polymerase II large subunit, partial [Nanoarchaeota archaeon]|nr:DNA polymerase II large subunit [Nanoarchaeota archaeon]